MLRVVVETNEFWDEIKQEFVSPKEQTLDLEHSLVSLSKWESKWHKPFLSKEKKSSEEIVDYIRCMTVNKVDQTVYDYLTKANFDSINAYIEDSMTATTFSDSGRGARNREQLTSELIYYYMIALNIPFECQKWHLNKLITLIKVCSIKNAPPKKMSRRDTMRQNSAINAARRSQYGTRG